MTARDEILARVRRNLGGSASAAVRRAGLSGSVVADADNLAVALRPRILANPGDEGIAMQHRRMARFVGQAKAMACTVDQISDPAAVPAVVAAYLRARQLPLRAVIWPELSLFDWSAAGVFTEARPANEKDAIGITGAFLALAETGTLMLLSGEKQAATVSLLPETHVAIVAASRIVDGMEEAYAGLHSEHSGLLPRAVNFVSGPSRTGDIEQTLVLGAHGPCRVHIVLITNA